MTRPVSDTILAHPALAGRILMIRREGRWAAHVIQPQGCLGDPQRLDTDPAQLNWRSGRAA
jgi:hypothetical protein